MKYCMYFANMMTLTFDAADGHMFGTQEARLVVENLLIIDPNLIVDLRDAAVADAVFFNATPLARNYVCCSYSAESGTINIMELCHPPNAESMVMWQFISADPGLKLQFDMAVNSVKEQDSLPDFEVLLVAPNF